MHKNDLVEILAALTTGERKHLLQSWQLESSSIRQECVLLVEFVLNYLNQEKPGVFSQEAAFKHVFPKQKWVENKLPKLMSETLKAVRRYIAVETFAAQMTDMQQAFYLQNFYEERNLPEKFEQGYKTVKKASRQKWTKDDYYSNFLVEAEAHIFLSNQSQKKDDLNLLNTIQALDEYYLFERLWFTCVLLNQNQITPINLPPLQEWLPFNIDSPHLQWFFEKPLGKIFRAAISIFSTDIEETGQHLQRFILLLNENEQEINELYLSSFEAFAISYATLRVNKGQFEYSNVILEIQKRRIESGRIYIIGKIKASDFQSIATIALRLDQFEWVKFFLETHRSKVLGSMPSEEYYQYNLAQYLYYLKDYEPALKTLLTSNYEDMQYKISAKILEIKILWEMSQLKKNDDWVAEFLENKVEAAIIYFFREKNLPATKKKMGKRFADTMKRIIHADGKRDVERLEIILQDIAKAEFIAERQWLTKLVEDLIAIHKKK